MVVRFDRQFDVVDLISPFAYQIRNIRRCVQDRRDAGPYKLINPFTYKIYDIKTHIFGNSKRKLCFHLLRSVNTSCLANFSLSRT